MKLGSGTKGKYLSGVATATSDKARGMSLDSMGKVVQPTDDKDWAQGYTDLLEEMRTLVAQS